MDFENRSKQRCIEDRDRPAKQVQASLTIFSFLRILFSFNGNRDFSPRVSSVTVSVLLTRILLDFFLLGLQLVQMGGTKAGVEHVLFLASLTILASLSLS